MSHESNPEMSDDRIEIDADSVARLIAAQFPNWAGLPVVPVELSGWDNRSFRLGSDMSVRLPSASRYAKQVAKEQRWLPRLAPHLPLPIRIPVAMGQPSDAYPFPWSIYRWIDGEPATTAPISGLTEFATTLAGFLIALQAIDASEGPAAGTHNFFRGGLVSTYDGETRHAIAALASEIDTLLATEVRADVRDGSTSSRTSIRTTTRPIWLPSWLRMANSLREPAAHP